MHGPICSALLAVTLAAAADPAEPPPVLPPPHDLVAPAPLLPPALPPPPLVYYPRNPRDVWLYYAPDRFGRMRPIVVLLPDGDGAVRLIDGRPVPAPYGQPQLFRPSNYPPPPLPH